MDNSNANHDPTILVLTEFSNRDKNASDAALKLAQKLKMGLMLLHVYPKNDIRSSARYAEDNDYLSEISKHFDKEKDRLNAMVNGRRKSSFTPTIQSYCSEGELSENVRDVLEKENIVMIVMGGRPLRNNDYLFCVEIDEVLYSTQRPVLVVPEQRTLDI